MSIDLGLKVLRSTDVKEYNERTVLIASPECTSVKLMCALSTTKHVVKESWLQACHDANQLLPTSSYVLNEHAQAILNGESLREDGKRLLSDVSIHRVTGRNVQNMPSNEELRDLVVVSGGEWVTTQRKAGNTHSHNLLLLMDDDTFDTFNQRRQANNIQELLERGATKIRWSDMRDCILTQSLNSIVDTKEPTPQKSRAQLFRETLSTIFTSPPKTRETSMVDGFKSHGAAEIHEEDASTPTKEGAWSNTAAYEDSTATNMTNNHLTLVYSTELKNLNRNLSNAEGDQSRGEIGAGIMNIFKSSNTGLLTVQVFNNGTLRFQSEVPVDFNGIFGNAGKENTLGWNAYDTSGTIVSVGTAIKKARAKNAKEAQLRRFFFHFESREHLTCVLFVLFGSDDNARKVVEEFFDGSGRFCPQQEPELPHRVINPNRMEIDSTNGEALALPSAPTTRLIFDNDPQESTQLF